MATFRSSNNTKAYGSVPQVFLAKNVQSGERIVSLDEIQIDSIAADGDIVLCQKIEANQKVLSVKIVNNENVADGVIDVGYSASADLGDKDATVAADGDAFIDGVTLAAGTPEHNIDTELPGFLVEFEKPVFLTVTFATAPTALDTKKLKIIVETIGK